MNNEGTSSGNIAYEAKENNNKDMIRNPFNGENIQSSKIRELQKIMGMTSIDWAFVSDELQELCQKCNTMALEEYGKIIRK